eukprot:TRINITY_DN9772_c0_g1_i1.p1 TRINITY_DN9772_c0_g1~~TRINITY_DN9772_c0_g1_i1.p1  ORF type:complete len:1878 (+),score=199.27 TRINITY_DN9772_c0_g1_i1:778-5634(+)
MQLVRESFTNRPMMSLTSRKEMLKFMNLHAVVVSALKHNSVAVAQKLTSLHTLLRHAVSSTWNLAPLHFPDAFSTQAAVRASQKMREAVEWYDQETQSVHHIAIDCNHTHLNLPRQEVAGDLFAAEETAILGCRSERRVINKEYCNGEPVLDMCLHGMTYCPVLSTSKSNVVYDFEQEVSQLCQVGAPQGDGSVDFKSEELNKKTQLLLEDLKSELFHGAKKSKVGERMVEDLEKSYLQWRIGTVQWRAQDPAGLRQKVEDIKHKVLKQEQSAFDYAMEMLLRLPAHRDFHNSPSIRDTDRTSGWLFALLRDIFSCRSSLPAWAGLPNVSAGSACKESFVEAFCHMLLNDREMRGANPFLKPNARKAIKDAIFVFLQLRVLTDRLDRILSLCGDENAVRRNEVELAQEIRCTRIWDVKKHPSWLVFEVSNRVQIRPQQYDVAKQLIDKNRLISQLNMGEGKTRVIMPMLALYWAFDANFPIGQKKLVRVTVLSPLLDELRQALHKSLTATPLQQKVFELPFTRDVDLASELAVPCVKKMLSTLQTCRDSGGILLVTPERRLSLLLKFYELSLENEVNRETAAGAKVLDVLKKVLEFPAIDLLDEADEILRHKFQLVYAIGHPIDLVNGTERWQTLMGILRIIQQSDAIHEIFRTHPNAVLFKKSDSAHRFNELRYSTASKDYTEKLKKDIAKTILDEFVHEKFLPFEFRGVKHPLSDEANLKTFKDFVLKHGQDLEKQRKNADSSTKGPRMTGLPHIVQVLALALRGFLTYRVLFHCLEKIWNRHYGVNPAGATESAVPYLFADTPSTRSEFSHIDVMLCYTCLSLYWGGLTEDQVRRAFKQLLQEGRHAAAFEYRRWFELSKSGMIDAGALDSVDKIDLTDDAQFKLLVQHFRCNYESVNFFLAKCVFPRETRQHPQYISANPCHLAEGVGESRGFSGTKDNKYVLPPQIKQVTLDSLCHTDGMMLAVLAHNSTYHACTKNFAGHEQILDEMLTHSYDVLIDCGGYMAGASNREVAEYALEISNKNRGGGNQLQGAIYFDNDLHGWAIVDERGVTCLAEFCSIAVKDCFAFFDESHTRGADLRLKADALAVVTVGPMCTKDKLMQAIGRMRKIMIGQTVHFFTTREVSCSIQESRPCKSSSKSINLADGSSSDESSDESKGDGSWVQRAAQPPTSMDIAYWVVLNTVSAIEGSLPIWARQCALYCTVQENPLLAPQDNEHDLETLYGSALKEQKISDLAKYSLQRMMKSAEDKLARRTTNHTTTNDASLTLRVSQAQSGVAAAGASDAALTTEERQRFWERQPYKEYRERIKGKLETFGGGRKILVNMLDEELERELQKEEEREYVRELPTAANPGAEVAWNYSQVFRAQTHAAFLDRTTIDISKFLQKSQCVGEGWRELGVSFTCVRATKNYVVSLEKQQQSDGSWNGEVYDDYMRPRIQFMLYFPRYKNGTFLLLSDYEAHRLTELFFECDVQNSGLQKPEACKQRVGKHLRAAQENSPATGSDVSLLHYSFLVEHDHTSAKGVPLALHSTSGLTGTMSEETLACLQIFNGDTVFFNEARRNHVRNLLHLRADDTKRETGIKVARLMVEKVRRRETDLDRSDLHKMIVEAGGTVQ